MTELIRRKNTGEAWKTEVDTDGNGGSQPFPSASTGNGAPVVDPATLAVGSAYLDTTNGALYMVVLVDAVKEWNLLGGEIAAALLFQGLILGNGITVQGKSVNGNQVVLSDVDAQADVGSANGIIWHGTGVDGAQELRVKIGPVGGPSKILTFNLSGGLVNPLDLDMSAGGAIFTDLPTSDPVVAGQLWNDGVVRVSGTTGSLPFEQHDALATDPDTFLVTETFDVGYPSLVTFLATVTAVDADGETFGPGAGELTGTSFYQVSFDGITWSNASVLVNSATTFAAVVVQGDLFDVGDAQGGGFMVPRFGRVTVAIIDNDSGDLYAGANNPTLAFTLDYYGA